MFFNSNHAKLSSYSPFSFFLIPLTSTPILPPFGEFHQKGEERKSDFFNVVAWRQQADFVHRYFTKGRLILVEGELTTRNYTDKNGNQATWYEIVADRISFTGEKSQGGSYNDYAASAPSAPAPQAPAQPAPQQAPAADFANAATDDYPF